MAKGRIFKSLLIEHLEYLYYVKFQVHTLCHFLNVVMIDVSEKYLNLKYTDNR